MPTVSDILALKLEIDSSGVDRGGDAAVREIERVRNAVKAQGDEIERITKNLGESVFTALRYFAGLMGVVLSFEGFRRLAVDVADSNTALARFAEAAGVSAQKVTELEQALDRAGGNAGDIRPVLSQMRSEMTTAQMGGTVPEWMKTLGLAPMRMGVQELMQRTPEETLLEISRRAQAAHLTPFQLRALMGNLNLSPETLAVITQPGELQRLLKDVREGGTGVSPEQIAAGERLKEKFATLAQFSDAVLRDLITLSEPVLQSLIKGITLALEWLDKVERSLIGSIPRAGTGAPPASSSSRPSGGMIGGRSGFGGFRPAPAGRATLGDRLNNPGNLKYGPFARQHGAIEAGPGGRAVFPDYASGRAAMEALLRNKGAGQSIAEIGSWYAEDPNWAAGVARAMGVSPSYRPTEQDISRLSDAIQIQEGTRIGGAPAARGGPVLSPGAVTAVGGGPPAAFIVHHTGGRGGIADVQRTLQERGLGVQYVMDREGNIYQIGGPGASQMMNGWGIGAGLSNSNTVGMEVIARDDKDVTPAQIAAARRFIAARYPNTPVFGHGEVNPGHKEADEGMSIVNAIRAQRQGAAIGIQFPNADTGAGAALKAPSPVNEINRNESSAVINHVTVNTHSIDAGNIARDIRDEVGRQLALPVTP